MTDLDSPIAPVPLAAPGAWHWVSRTADIDVHARVQPDWQLEYQQLSGGAFTGLVHHVQLPGLRLVREDCNRALRQRGQLSAGCYAFAMPLEISGAAFLNGQRVERNAIMAGRLDELDLCTPTQVSLIGVVVDAELLNPLWERMYLKRPSAWLETQVVVPARPGAVEALRSIHLKALHDISAGDSPFRGTTALLQLRDAILIEWIEALPEVVDTSELPTAAARKRLVDRACELMLGAPDEPLSMLEVCRRVGASRRKLNYCFQDVLGSSPVKYLRAVRLNGVRRELRGGAHPVQDVAARWGFWHLGQFSLDYKRQFGELPSTTLKRARGSAASSSS
jgi:AraC family transcriptional regulator, ethanolamine operon transcriptional activator